MKRFISLFLSIIMLMSVITGINFSANASVSGSEIIAYARQFIGYPYVYNAKGPNSFDCSGFVQYVFKNFGISLPASSSSYWNYPSSYGTVVGTGSTANAKAGDVISWSGHVAIYTENGYCVEALNSTYGVCERFKVDAHTNGTNYRVIRINGITSGANGNMTVPIISFGRNTNYYYVGDKITIKWAATSSNTDFYQYWIIIKNTTTNKEYYGGDAGSTGNVSKNSYTFTVSAAGSYLVTVYSVPKNDKNSRQKSATKTFTANTTGMTTPTITTNKNEYTLGEKVNISWAKTSSATDFYQYWLIVKNTTTNKQYYGDSPGLAGDVSKNSYSFTPTEKGTYYVTVYSVPYYNKDSRQKVATKSITVNAKCSHTYTSVVTKVATCTSTGSRKYTCSKCGYSYTTTISSTGHTYDNGKIIKSAICKATGVKTYTCTVCNATKTETIAKKAHSYKNYVTKATTSKNGSIVNKCSMCGAKKSSSTIYKIKSVALSTTATYYNGKVKTPGVTVKDSAGKTLKKGTDYTVSYESGRKNVGRYAVKITFKGNYSGSKTLYFNIIPKNVTGIKKLTAGKKRFTVSWKPQKTQVTGYQIRYSTASNLKNAKTITMGKSSYSAKKVTGRMANKRYYVQIRTYKTVKFNGKNYNIYSPWSAKKSVVTKK